MIGNLVGNKGENIAQKYLIDKGYKIIGRNFHCRLGEIDVICTHKDFLVFVEVKTRSSNRFGYPLESIGRKKLNSLIKTSQIFMSKNKNLPKQVRFDAVEVILDKGEILVNHVENITF